MVAMRATLRGGVCSLLCSTTATFSPTLSSSKPSFLMVAETIETSTTTPSSSVAAQGRCRTQRAVPSASKLAQRMSTPMPLLTAMPRIASPSAASLSLGGNVSWRSRNPAGDRQAADARGEARLRVEADCFSEEPVVGGQHEAVEVVLAVGDDGHRRAGSFAANGIVGVMSDAGVGVHDAGLRVFAEDGAGSGLPTRHGAGVGIGVQVLGKALRILRRILFSLLIRQKTMKRLSRVIFAAS